MKNNIGQAFRHVTDDRDNTKIINGEPKQNYCESGSWKQKDDENP